MEKLIIYQIFTRLFGNATITNIPHGSILENDGMNPDKAVILPESMAGPGGKIWNVRAAHVNHQEMGNHPKMKEIFEKAYGSDEYGQIFNLRK